MIVPVHNVLHYGYFEMVINVKLDQSSPRSRSFEYDGAVQSKRYPEFGEYNKNKT